MRSHLLACLLCAPLLAGDRDDLPFLVASLDSPTPAVTDDAQRRLLLIGPEALPLLRSAAEDELVRRANLRPRVERMIRDLDSEDYDTRERAQLDLIEIGSEALPALGEALARGTPEQRMRAQAAIAAIASVSTSPPRFMLQVARAIASQPDDACVPALLALASQPEREIMSEAIQGLWRLSSPAALAALDRLARDPHVERRWLALAALAATGAEVRLDERQFVSDWPSDATRAWVYAALRRWESPDVVRFALAALEREGASAPRALLAVLEDVADASLLTREIATRLGGRSQTNRGALMSLLREPTRDAVAAATAGLDDPEWRAREAAVVALARFLGERAAPRIEPLLRDPEQPVRLAALRALHAVTGTDPGPFRTALETPVRAGEALGYALVRLPGAELIRAIRPRPGGPSAEASAAIDRWLQRVVDGSLSSAADVAPSDGPSVLLGDVSGYVQAAARLLNGPLPPRPVPLDSAASRFLAFVALPPQERRKAVRDGFESLDTERRLEATRWALWDDLDGFEEEMARLLACGNADTEEMACLYLARRKSSELLDRVRRLARGASPGSAALLWVQWEGRDAARALLDRLTEPGAPPRGVLHALSRAPLLPEDAPILLAVTPPDGEADALWRALRRTGSPACVARLREAALGPARSGPSDADLIEFAADPAHSELVLRAVRASRDVAGDSEVHLARFLAAMGTARAAEELERQDPHVVAGEARLLAPVVARRDLSAARKLAARWHRSLHLARRLSAVWLSLALGEAVPAETIEVLRSGEAWHRFALLQAGRASGSHALLRECVPLLNDPDATVRLGAWHAIAEGLGANPEGHANDFAIPSESRSAWQAWFDSHSDSGRGEVLAGLIAENGWPAGDEGLLHAFVAGPWHVSMAALLEHGSAPEDLPRTPRQFVDEAVKWRDSLR